MGSEKLAFYMYGKTINNLSKRETLILGKFLYLSSSGIDVLVSVLVGL